MLKQLADTLELMAAQDLTTVPNMQCSQALIDTLVDQEGFDPSFARKIVFRMKISLTQFDADNKDWQRIIVSYATLIRKLYEQTDNDSTTMLEVAKGLSLTYEF